MESVYLRPSSSHPAITANGIYYSNTASSLSKLPLGEIYSEAKKTKKGGDKSALSRPGTKKQYPYVNPKVNTGAKKSLQTGGSNMSDGLAAKRKDELFGRVTSHTLAKFL
jgi:hypothetical protein